MWFYTIKRFRDLVWRILFIFFGFVVYAVVLLTIAPNETEGQFALLDTLVFLICSILILVFIGGYIYTRFIKK